MPSADSRLVAMADDVAAAAVAHMRLAIEQLETAAGLIVNASGRVPGVPMPDEHRAVRYTEAAQQVRAVLDQHFPVSPPEPVSIYSTGERPNGFIVV